MKRLFLSMFVLACLASAGCQGPEVRDDASPMPSALSTGVGGGSGGEREQRIEKTARLLDEMRARQITQADALARFRARLEEHGDPHRDKKLLRIDKTLTRVVGLLPASYDATRTQWAQRIENIMRARKGTRRASPSLSARPAGPEESTSPEEAP